MNAINQSGWKPEMGNAGETAPATFTGNKALMLEEALIFEIGTAATTGVDLADAPRLPRAWAIWSGIATSAFPDCRNLKPSAITPA